MAAGLNPMGYTMPYLIASAPSRHVTLASDVRKEREVKQRITALLNQKDELQSHKKRCQEADDDNATAEAFLALLQSCKAYKKTLKTASKNLDELRTNYNVVLERDLQLKSDLEKIRSEQRQERSATEELRAKCHALGDDKKEAEERATIQQEELAKLRLKLADSIAEVDFLTHEKEEQMGELRIAQRTIDRVRATQMSCLQPLQNSKAELERTNTHLRTQIEDCKQTQQTFKQQLVSAELKSSAARKELQTKEKRLDQQLADANIELNAVRTANADLETKQRNIADAFDQLKADYKGIKHSKEEVDRQLAAANHELDEARDAYAQLEASERNQASEFSQMEADYTQKLQLAQYDIDRAQEELEETEEELQRTKERLEIANDDIHTIRDNLETAADELQAAKEEQQISTRDLQAQLESSRTQLAQRNTVDKEELTEMRVTVAELYRQLSTANTRRQQIDSALEELQLKNMRYKDDLREAQQKQKMQENSSIKEMKEVLASHLDTSAKHERELERQAHCYHKQLSSLRAQICERDLLAAQEHRKGERNGRQLQVFLSENEKLVQKDAHTIRTLRDQLQLEQASSRSTICKLRRALRRRNEQIDSQRCLLIASMARSARSALRLRIRTLEQHNKELQEHIDAGVTTARSLQEDHNATRAAMTSLRENAGKQCQELTITLALFAQALICVKLQLQQRQIQVEELQKMLADAKKDRNYAICQIFTAFSLQPPRLDKDHDPGSDTFNLTYRHMQILMSFIRAMNTNKTYWRNTAIAAKNLSCRLTTNVKALEHAVSQLNEQVKMAETCGAAMVKRYKTDVALLKCAMEDQRKYVVVLESRLRTVDEVAEQMRVKLTKNRPATNSEG
ncbi:hypothetical protein HBI71_004940 [Parastagonospora nodorum]|nr:hypothetical protein HBI71_004940 [Parastagonospora nodorum]KAH5414414.1 hypothetical protein HBI47_153260 [Parastagonospora nodorum]